MRTTRSTKASTESKRAQRAATRKPRLIMERLGQIEDLDRSFDVEFWQRLGDKAIFDAAWELVEFYQRETGRNMNELRLQRSVEHFQRARR